MASGLLAFIFLRLMITGFTRFGIASRELTQQEVNVVQTFITAASGVAFTGGFGMCVAWLPLSFEMVAVECHVPSSRSLAVVPLRSPSLTCLGPPMPSATGRRYLIAMDQNSYELSGDSPANRPEDVYNPNLGRVIPYLLCTSLIGAFMLCVLRKTIIIDYKLPYPSGTATGHMIKAFFTKT